MNLYHATSRAIAERIKVEGFYGHAVFSGERPATGGSWLKDNPGTDATLGLVMMSIAIPDDELVDQAIQAHPVLEGQRSKDYSVDAKTLNRYLKSIQIES
jgi:hypothetical protein